jgi:hypothetical protein
LPHLPVYEWVWWWHSVSSFIANLFHIAHQVYSIWSSWKSANIFFYAMGWLGSGPLQWWDVITLWHLFCHFQWFTIFVWPSAAPYNLDTILGYVSSHWQFMWCHSDHFWPFPMFDIVFMEFSMFARVTMTPRLSRIRTLTYYK